MSTLMSVLPKEIAGLSRAAGGFIAKLRQLFIDGKWVAAASGKTFEVVNPATGEVVAAWPGVTRRTSIARWQLSAPQQSAARQSEPIGRSTELAASSVVPAECGYPQRATRRARTSTPAPRCPGKWSKACLAGHPDGPALCTSRGHRRPTGHC